MDRDACGAAADAEKDGPSEPSEELLWFESFSESRSRAAVTDVKRTMGQLIKAGTKQISDTELGRIAIPTALLSGRHDRFVPLGLAEGASARLGWPLRGIEDAGHAPHIERPAAFVGALRTALGKFATRRGREIPR